MSIIERAADRLGKKTVTERAPQTPASAHLDQANSSAKADENMPGNENEPVNFHAVSAVQKQISINLDRLHQLGIVTPQHGKTQIAEQFRLIKRPLLINAFNQNTGIKNGNLIMVTSSLAGEGKSFCSINLAMSIAMERDHRVLLIDADVARPSIPRILDFSPEKKGLLDIILDDYLDVSDILIKTSIEKLTIISAGTRHPHATELLASQNMRNILTELAQRYRDRIVIFDSPPLLLTSEARVLASQMGQIVLVVEAERTTQQTVKEALRQIESCDVVNLIYNKARAFSGAGTGYYGYYYS
ncbi:XrtA-associated tyrosine autokinase [Nitrosomonas sp. Nm132]|jgi:exopolysaccharide/PEP-CTERM locus tyrosine autokinase|uniref:XrtA-associated tyrosine autokinase n=1 Tax=Nitrosomonas sp. Nm132 TaxID=1881053 RepID=UPI000881F685|nr:XrtA-associated tyrosine autokinase [Nitrosomonas sp. Nm132]SDH23558.1 exopolysaccharide/PEP-CTERM locus tyrosine autokinase [Nitrosomonas sp. Nm132]